MDNTGDLGLLLESRYPLLMVETRDEERFLAVLRRVAEDLELPVWTWSATRGLARDGHGNQYGTRDPRVALDWVGTLDGPGVFVFADLHPALDDAVVVRHLKEIAAAATERGQTIVVTAPERRMPTELEGVAVPWALRPPQPEELERLVQRTIADLTERGIEVALDEADVERFASTLRGLSLGDAERLVQRAALEGGGLFPADIAGIRSAKAELLNVDGVLELVEAEVGTLDDVGGMDGIKAWLEQRRLAMLNPGTRLDQPRGMLLTGVPGCGKSLVAKTLARTWDLPLVLLDPGRLYGPYIGESEARLRKALTAIDAMAPVVLWVDEIEKGFASSGRGDGGVSKRVLGTFLRWLQERPDGVFVVATANDVASLPPELLRKGRLDEIFFVDLPDAAARRHIFELQLRRRDLDPAGFDVATLAAAAEGYSGAEIEAAVVGALYRTLAGGRDPATADVLAELRSTVPLSITRAEDVAALRDWAQGRARAA